jgi:hypothetical protein
MCLVPALVGNAIGGRTGGIIGSALGGGIPGGLLGAQLFKKKGSSKPNAGSMPAASGAYGTGG